MENTNPDEQGTPAYVKNLEAHFDKKEQPSSTNSGDDHSADACKACPRCQVIAADKSIILAHCWEGEAHSELVEACTARQKLLHFHLSQPDIEALGVFNACVFKMSYPGLFELHAQAGQAMKRRRLSNDESDDENDREKDN